MEITRTSIVTGVTRTRDIPVTQEQLERWQKGGLIQDVMPELSDEDREFVQSGMTAAEWQEMELDDGPDIVELGSWTLGDDGGETRLIIGQDDEGYRFAVETLGATVEPERIVWSAESFETVDEAREAGEKRELGFTQDELGSLTLMWAELALACAPNIAVPTMEAIIRVESGGNPLAINVNGIKMQPVVPKTVSEVAALANHWITRGFTVDLGLAQINSANLSALGLTAEEILDPCTNLRAAGAILTAEYGRAAGVHGPGQRALQAALSAYNTGHAYKGFRNGYVQRYYSPVPVAPERSGKNRKTMQNPFTGKSAVAWPEMRNAQAAW